MIGPLWTLPHATSFPDKSPGDEAVPYRLQNNTTDFHNPPQFLFHDFLVLWFLGQYNNIVIICFTDAVVYILVDQEFEPAVFWEGLNGVRSFDALVDG